MTWGAAGTAVAVWAAAAAGGEWSGCELHGFSWGPEHNLREVNPNPVPGVSTPGDCRALCREHSSCQWWSHGAARQECRLCGDVLKDAPNRFWSVAPRFPGPPLPAPGFVSGPRSCAVQGRPFTEGDLLQELQELYRCSSPLLAPIAARLALCRRRASPDAAFHHWQVHHPGAAWRRTYPLREWEHCASERRTCRCYTTVRFGVLERGQVVGATLRLDVSSPARGRPLEAIRCVPQSFPGGPAPEGRRRGCECRTDPAERAAQRGALYLSIAVGPGATADPADPCSIALDELAPRLGAVALGWGETAAHVALGLAARCLGLPRWASAASWKQAAKGYRLPCNALADAPLQVPPLSDAPDVGFVYSQGVRHWRWMPMNVTMRVRDTVRRCFGVTVPSQLVGGSGTAGGNPHMPRLWQRMGWTHPCCQYTVLPREAHVGYAQFVAVVTAALSRELEDHSGEAGAYCLLWRSGGGCVPRWYGYLGEMLHIVFVYASLRLVALQPGASPQQCMRDAFPSMQHRGALGRLSAASHRLLGGTLSLPKIESVFRQVVLDGGSC